MAHAEANRPSWFQHHFTSPVQQFESAKLGMWLFLAQEVLFFSGLFVAYGVVRVAYPEAFAAGAAQLDWVMGGLNTIVLLFSSLTAALAVRYAQLGDRKMVSNMLYVTILCAFGFLVIKYFEYAVKFEHGLLPGTHWHPHLTHATELLPAHTHVFFGIYFMLTGLHGVHVVIGIGVLAWIAVRNNRGEFNSEYWTPVDLAALYWHLVDLVWIFLFPLLYLILRPPMSSHTEPSYRDAHTTDDPADERVHVHVHPVSFYVKIFLALAGLTIFTVASSRLDIDGFVSPGTVRGAGIFNFILAMVVACVKASLVVTFFMHLKDDNRFNALIFLGSVLFAGVFLAYTLNDTNHRNDGDRFHGLHVIPSTGERAPGGVDHQFTFEEPEAGIERTEEFVPHGDGHEGAEGEAHEGAAAEGDAAHDGDAHEGEAHEGAEEAPAEGGH